VVVSTLLNGPVDWTAVQVVPPSHDNWTHILGEPAGLSVRASSLTSMPVIVAVIGREKL
jgi:hypothetical protein